MRLDGMQGRSLGRVTFVPADRLSVVNYARALSITEPTFLSVAAAREAGWPSRPVPGGMFAFFLPLSEDALTEDLGVVYGKTLAGEIRLDVARTAAEEETIQGECLVDAAWERDGRDGAARQYVRLCSEFRDDEGQPVTRIQVTLIERRDGPRSATLPEADPGDLAPPWRLDGERPAASRLGALAKGQELPGHVTAALGRLEFARMSVALDDPNLVHLDEGVAQAAGLPTVIGSGGFILGSLAEVARRCSLPGSPCTVRMRQVRPFGPGTALVTSARVDDVGGPDRQRWAECAAEVADQEGEIVARGTITLSG